MGDWRERSVRPSPRQDADVLAYLETQRFWLRVEGMPAYPPELNPVEGVWGHLRGGVLAHRGDDTVEALIELAHDGVRKARSEQRLLFSFLGQSGVAL